MLSHESRWLRLGGIALIVFAMGLFAYLEDTVDLRRLLQPGDRSPFAQVALLFFATVNVFALGLVLLLAGLRELSLRTDVQARRGALARMGAANLMLFCFAVVGLEESGTLEDIYSTWYILPLLLAFVVVARVSILWFRSGWKYEALTAEEAMNQDRRPPVLYLRSFHVDDQILVNTGSRARNLADHVHYTASVSPEQEMAFIMEGLGPLIAIGKPGEPLPELGAARLYVGNDEWRATVARLMTDAALVVIRAGETANLWWEIEEAMTRCSPERVVILGKAASTQPLVQN
jgi:hypothetical protein